MIRRIRLLGALCASAIGAASYTNVQALNYTFIDSGTLSEAADPYSESGSIKSSRQVAGLSNINRGEVALRWLNVVMQNIGTLDSITPADGEVNEGEQVVGASQIASVDTQDSSRGAESFPWELYLPSIQGTEAKPLPNSDGVTGQWVGKAASAIYPCAGDLSVSLKQSGTALTGSVQYLNPQAGAQCIPSVSDGITGTIQENSITFGLSNYAGFTFKGTVSGTSMSGTWDWPNIPDSGTWFLNRN